MSKVITIKLDDLIELGLCICDCELDQEETITYIYEFLEDIKKKEQIKK